MPKLSRLKFFMPNFIAKIIPEVFIIFIVFFLTGSVISTGCHQPTIKSGERKTGHWKRVDWSQGNYPLPEFAFLQKKCIRLPQYLIQTWGTLWIVFLFLDSFFLFAFHFCLISQSLVYYAIFIFFVSVIFYAQQNRGTDFFSLLCMK